MNARNVTQSHPVPYRPKSPKHCSRNSKCSPKKANKQRTWKMEHFLLQFVAKSANFVARKNVLFECSNVSPLYFEQLNNTSALNI